MWCGAVWRNGAGYMPKIPRDTADCFFFGFKLCACAVVSMLCFRFCCVSTVQPRSTIAIIEVCFASIFDLLCGHVSSCGGYQPPPIDHKSRGSVPNDPNATGTPFCYADNRAKANIDDGQAGSLEWGKRSCAWFDFWLSAEYVFFSTICSKQFST